jgi:hypothetical protein
MPSAYISRREFYLCYIQRLQAQISPQQTVLYQTVHVHLLNQTDIRHADNSLFLRKDGLGIYCLACVSQLSSILRLNIASNIVVRDGVQPILTNQSTCNSAIQRQAIYGYPF